MTKLCATHEEIRRLIELLMFLGKPFEGLYQLQAPVRRRLIDKVACFREDVRRSHQVTKATQ